MRNYVIINGVSSLTIPGLAIKSLPPITKPIQRTLREEIDGRDGDIITELGYGAYDKEIEIGLFGNFDVDQIIAYFNQKGTITFSNEPDKVYYFQALNQADYEELIKFREAGVTLHCQPFKYPVTEEPLIEEYEYVDGSGESITLDNTEETTFNEIKLQGNTEQFQTTGIQMLEINADSFETRTLNGVTITNNDDGSIKLNGTVTENAMSFKASNTMSTNMQTSERYYLKRNVIGGTLTDGISPIILFGKVGEGQTVQIKGVSGDEDSFIPQASYTSIWLYVYAEVGRTFNNYIIKPILSKVQNADWEPYTGGNPAPNPDYPEDIHVVSGDNEITIHGKNYAKVPDATITGTGYSYEANNGHVKIVSNKKNGAFDLTGGIRTGEWAPGLAAARDDKLTPADQGTYRWSFQNIEISIAEGTAPQQIDVCTNKRKLTGGIRATGETYGELSVTLTSEEYIKSIYLWVNGNDNITNLEFDLQLERGTSTSLFEPYNGDTYQINLPVENKFDIESATEGKYIDASGNLQNTANSDTSDFIEIEANKPYTLSYKFTLPFNSQSRREIVLYNTSKTFIKTITLFPIGSGGITFIPDQAGYIRFDYDKKCYDIQLEPGEKKNSFTPYGIEPMEMCLLPGADNKDTFEYDFEEDKWYKIRKIGKKALKSTEVNMFQLNTGTNYNTLYISKSSIGIPTGWIGNLMLCSHFKEFKPGTATLPGQFQTTANGNNAYFYITTETATLAAAKTYMDGLENSYAYFLLATPTREEVTYEPLIEQLNNLLEATSKRGQTNISQINNDLPFIMAVSAFKLGSDVITIPDGGNIYSKPTIKIEGTGIVDIYLNDVQEFEVDLTEDNEITIDTEKMEAYTETGLANRKVTGDYSKFKLQPGDNEVRFSGALTKATITRYTRWL